MTVESGRGDPRVHMYSQGSWQDLVDGSLPWLADARQCGGAFQRAANGAIIAASIVKLWHNATLYDVMIYNIQ